MKDLTEDTRHWVVLGEEIMLVLLLEKTSLGNIKAIKTVPYARYIKGNSGC